mmetsp:Transcript_85122/g.150559  ORF Transcript_85122/g.150559 Transcript_85122/m.150559 type:complete len:331 (+) Transcript_85122:54-1046(+)
MDPQRRKAAPCTALASPRPAARRLRRLSAPASAQAIAICMQKQWVTTNTAAWRTAPSVMGFRIDTLPKGWQVTEANWAEEPVKGWIPIEPRGFLQICDLAQAPSDEDAVPAEASPVAATPPSSKGSPSCASPQDATAASTRAALLALREEHVRLREANVQLRERELKKRQEVDSLCRTREETARELAQMQEQVAAEREELQHCREQRERLQIKLDRCREVVATAVSSVDRLYAEGLEAKAQVVDEVMAAGTDVNRMRADLTDSPREAEEEEAAPEAAAPIYDEYSLSHENADRIKTKAKASDALKKKVDDLSRENSQLQRAPLRDLNSVQ